MFRILYVLFILVFGPLFLFLTYFQPKWEGLKKTSPFWFIVLAPIFFPLGGLMYILMPIVKKIED